MKNDSPIRKFRQAWKRRKFKRSGMKPWTKGYIEHKHHEIDRLLKENSFPSGPLPEGYGFRIDERVVEYPWFFSKLLAGPGTLLDAGSVLNFGYILDHPSLQNKKLHICTLAPEGDCFWKRGISYLFDDLRQLPYRDDWFDWVVSLSTLEHVGMDNTLLYTEDRTKKEAQLRDYLRAVEELKRVLKRGATLYVSVPFGKARDHGWLQIFDQAKIEELIQTFAPASQTTEYFLYDPTGWKRSDAAEAASAEFFDIHHSKLYDPDFAASARAVCCMQLTK